MRLAISDLSMALVAACVIGGVSTTAVASLDQERSRGSAAQASEALPAGVHLLRSSTADGFGEPASFRSEAMAGRWVREFSAEPWNGHVDLFFGPKSSDFVSMARYASSAPFALTDVQSPASGEAIALRPAGQAFVDATVPSERVSGYRQPNEYAMLLAGLVLIGLMARQRMSAD